MTSQQAVPPTGLVADYYRYLGPLLQMAWDDNFHLGYWEDENDKSTPEEATDRFTDLLIERLRVGPGDRVLDVGCGIGKPALRLAAATGASVLGITISEAQVQQATERAEAEDASGLVRFQYADGTAMPFEDGSFDAVLAFESVSHMDRTAALREMARVLVPGGPLVLTDLVLPEVLSAGDDPHRPEDDPGVLTQMIRLDDWPALVAGAGLLLSELTDVSAQTQGTFGRLIDNMVACREEFERAHGMTVQEVLDSCREVLPNVSTIGCLIVVAHKP